MTAVVVVLLWVLCGGVAAFLAQAKGRSPGNWFLCGFFFGPFGVIVCVVASDRRHSRMSRSRYLSWTQ